MNYVIISMILIIFIKRIAQYKYCMKKKVFITGSAGFIGFHLSKYLLDKRINVHGYDSMNNYYDVK